MNKKNSNTNSVLGRVAQKIIERGAKWPPDCGGYIYQAERPAARLETEDATENDNSDFHA